MTLPADDPMSAESTAAYFFPDSDVGPMRRARALVESHIADYGMVPHPDKIKEAIAVELGLAEIRGADRRRKTLNEGAPATETWAHIERLLVDECGLLPDQGLGYQRVNCINAIKNAIELASSSWKEQFESAANAASEYSEFYFAHAGLFDMAGNYIPHSQIDGDLRAAKVELASRNLRITGLEEALKQTRDQLIKVRDAQLEIRNHDLETNQVISRAWHMLNFGGVS